MMELRGLADRVPTIQHTSALRCPSAWGPNADRRGNALNCLRKEGSTLKPIHSGLNPNWGSQIARGQVQFS